MQIALVALTNVMNPCKKNLAKSFIHKIPMCDYYSNYRACRPQLAHCFSSVSFLINEALVITGFMRGGF